MHHHKLINVGIIVGVHGIKGHVIIRSYTNPDTNIVKLPIVNEKNQLLKITYIKKSSKNQLICKIDNINDRNIALSFKNVKLYCHRDSLPEITNFDEYYITDLKELEVMLEETNKPIGIIQNIHNFGAGDVVEVKFYDNKTEFYPFSEQFFPTISNNYIVLRKRLNY